MAKKYLVGQEYKYGVTVTYGLISEKEEMLQSVNTATAKNYASGSQLILTSESSGNSEEYYFCEDIDLDKDNGKFGSWCKKGDTSMRSFSVKISVPTSGTDILTLSKVQDAIGIKFGDKVKQNLIEHKPMVASCDLILAETTVDATVEYRETYDKVDVVQDFISDKASSCPKQPLSQIIIAGTVTYPLTMTITLTM